MKCFLSFIIFLSLVTSSCKSNNSGGNLAGSDSLIINFNVKGSNVIEKAISTTEKNAIKKLARFIDSKTISSPACGYDGNIKFYKKGVEAGDASYNISADSCRHFIQLINSELKSTKLSNEAADFLRSLSEGKNWY